MKTKLLIFGITGDLSRRKLLPALREIIKTYDTEIEIIGITRQEIGVEDLLPGDDILRDRLTMFTMDLNEPSEYVRLKDYLSLADHEQALMYLSVPPGSSTGIACLIGEAGLNTSNIKILFEKPFGLDLASAQIMINKIAIYFSESQIYRVDHYMAKEIAHEVIRLCRDADCNDHPWSKEVVASVEVVAHETLGVEGRGHFYEQTGAIRDVIQGHLMQLLSLVLMNPPEDIADLPEARRQALDKVEPVALEDTVKSQYEGYREEVGVSDSDVETYAKLTLHSSDPIWEGVPLILETGKKMPEKKTYIRLVYRDGKEDVFDESKVVFEDDVRLKDAYEHVILDAVAGRREIFTTSGEVLASWRVLQELFK